MEEGGALSEFLLKHIFPLLLLERGVSDIFSCFSLSYTHAFRQPWITQDSWLISPIYITCCSFNILQLFWFCFVFSGSLEHWSDEKKPIWFFLMMMIGSCANASTWNLMCLFFHPVSKPQVVASPPVLCQEMLPTHSVEVSAIVVFDFNHYLI